MTRAALARALTLFFSLAAISPGLGDRVARAGDTPFWRVRRTVVVKRVEPRVVRTASLGTFFPTPYVYVRGSAPAGYGYSPNGIYGGDSLSLYGPLSPFRTTTAPILTYVRGYDGRIRVTEGASFSTPNLPAISPVRYPTQANYYYGPRVIREWPWGTNAINWIDQN